jgi:hypothetical protein
MCVRIILHARGHFSQALFRLAETLCFWIADSLLGALLRAQLPLIITARTAYKARLLLLSVTTGRPIMKKDHKIHVVAHDDKRYAIAYGDSIHIEDSDNEVQYMGTTTALTSTHHMQQQQQHTEDIGEH